MHMGAHAEGDGGRNGRHAGMQACRHAGMQACEGMRRHAKASEGMRHARQRATAHFANSAPWLALSSANGRWLPAMIHGRVAREALAAARSASSHPRYSPGAPKPPAGSFLLWESPVVSSSAPCAQSTNTSFAGGSR